MGTYTHVHIGHTVSIVLLDAQERAIGAKGFLMKEKKSVGRISIAKRRKKQKMSAANKCDRCGEYYESRKYEYVVYKNTLNLAKGVVDLCPSCERELRQWLDNKVSFIKEQERKEFKPGKMGELINPSMYDKTLEELGLSVGCFNALIKGLPLEMCRNYDSRWSIKVRELVDMDQNEIKAMCNMGVIRYRELIKALSGEAENDKA